MYPQSNQPIGSTTNFNVGNQLSSSNVVSSTQTETSRECSRIEGDCERLLQTIRNLQDRIDLILIQSGETVPKPEPIEVIPKTGLNQFIRTQSGKIEKAISNLENIISRVEL
jgi:hypothetical protein